jgi:polysaccharide deacetylase 2 family uncharacterized protein YibQ
LILAMTIVAPGLNSAELKYPLLADPADHPEKSLLQVQPMGLVDPDDYQAEGEPLVQRSPDPAPEFSTATDSRSPLTTDQPDPSSEATVSAPASSSAQETNRPMIAIIIDDLGNQRLPGERTVALRGPVACAIMPHTSYSIYLANQAHAAGKEVLLHLPMQPIEMQRIAGPGEISLDTRRPQLHQILQADLASVPHAVGVNNHMGSLITRHPGHMRWLMEELQQRGNLFFVDSYTTPSSVAFEIAVEKGVPAARRHVFLDGEATEAHVASQFKRLKQEARKQGFAIAIGHPYPVTLAYLERALEDIEQEGFRLVPVAQIIEQHPAQYPDDFREPALSNARPDKESHW